METLAAGVSTELAVSSLGSTALVAVVVVMAEGVHTVVRPGVVREIFHHKIRAVFSWLAAREEDPLDLFHDEAVLLLGAPRLHPGDGGRDVSCHVERLVTSGNSVRRGLAVLDPDVTIGIELPDSIPEEHLLERCNTSTRTYLTTLAASLPLSWLTRCSMCLKGMTSATSRSLLEAMVLCFVTFD